MKRFPLLILGLRQSGKSSALLGMAKSIKDVIGIAPSMTHANTIFGKEIKHFSSHILKQKHFDSETKLVIDEFTLCENIPMEGQIIALTDDIENFKSVIKKLKELGYR